jgi:hypothetical protein
VRDANNILKLMVWILIPSNSMELKIWQDQTATQWNRYPTIKKLLKIRICKNTGLLRSKD